MIGFLFGVSLPCDRQLSPLMNILLLNSARKFIGEAAHCLSLAREFSIRGHRVWLGVRSGFELEQHARQEGHCTVVPFTFSGSFSPASDVCDASALRRLIRTEAIDVVHCHRGKDHWVAAAALLFLPLAPPLVRTRHVVVPMATHWFNRWLLTRRTRRVIAVSKQAAAGLGPMRDMLGDRLRVIYSAADTQRFHPDRRSAAWRAQMGVAEDGLLVGLVARLQNIKGQRQFLEAAAILAPRFPAAKFLVAGRGSDERLARLREMATTAGIADRVIFSGWLDDVATAIASLDVSVVASLGSEGSSRISYESMASGTALVATTVGCIPEITRDGETALLVPPADSAALAQAIGRLLDDAPLRASLAARALDYVGTHHTIDRWLNDTLAVYKEALDQ